MLWKQSDFFFVRGCCLLLFIFLSLSISLTHCIACSLCIACSHCLCLLLLRTFFIPFYIHIYIWTFFSCACCRIVNVGDLAESAERHRKGRMFNKYVYIFCAFSMSYVEIKKKKRASYKNSSHRLANATILFLQISGPRAISLLFYCCCCWSVVVVSLGPYTHTHACSNDDYVHLFASTELWNCVVCSGSQTFK